MPESIILPRPPRLVEPVRGQPQIVTMIDDDLLFRSGRRHRDLLRQTREWLERQDLVSARRVELPLFELHSNPTISLAEVRARRFNLIDRGAPLPIVAEILAAILRTKLHPERYGPLHRQSRYEVLVS